MENCKAHNPPNELEVIQMLRIDTRVRINLKGIVIVGGVLEETVERIEHLVREEKEKFTNRYLSVHLHKELQIMFAITYRERPP
jgi:hypothetical protein